MPPKDNVECPASLLASQAALEEQHVRRVYDAIAWQWHGTRYKAWPRVVEFVRSLPHGSLVADLGCGNGKLAPACAESGLAAVGCDFSSELVRIAAREMRMEALVADCLALPYRDASFDAALSIAVLHHISSVERRRALVSETMRVLRAGGVALFYAWALEQQEGVSNHGFAARDVLVPFHQRDSTPRRSAELEAAAGGVHVPDKRATVFQRYCHVYSQGEPPTRTSAARSHPSPATLSALSSSAPPRGATLARPGPVPSRRLHSRTPRPCPGPVLSRRLTPQASSPSSSPPCRAPASRRSTTTRATGARWSARRGEGRWRGELRRWRRRGVRRAAPDGARARALAGAKCRRSAATHSLPATLSARSRVDV
ncbi:hypothetical protein EMIHUDRAFT_434315 [Emiliania huxleyi CCMP1516]|uniref:Methyltransferase type 11 domain-containing protein n=2 Tax=Emiliania huxleyi TaxID=2903 RepID=A0A0D3HZ58_EMIH1|nr:hypothetical protein EMIHUDRAFT_446673 [Emiliania huxleyi CCMP1516]XP_005783393.1 hypothetical protein EMIHUDRAFT_434315 [Emiliania huxleyi CCMP1516]EOD04293.1 hypothetical protein EMIHUDRAFT_446673 [Emiliania huxleyi CCMP1516]EOD30964.1 hypothetical protein EMIHUDRAFT_434315 [Emiliania huxleyi CCMP1516]|eukprot:XP_005756722.1 hypothetical protein EMIHUDRAFT_446673 [Emiliania huxleyi CCMP1516]